MADVIVERLTKSHDRTSFDCGVEELNDFLKTKARKHADQNVSVTWVAVERRESKILGFITATLGTISFDEAPTTVTKGLPKYPLPVVHIGRLATDIQFQGRGIASLLLRAIAEETIDISNKIGCLGMELVATNDQAYQYYLRRGFIVLSAKNLRLFMPVSVLKTVDHRAKGP